jgi:TPR repeat protein
MNPKSLLTSGQIEEKTHEEYFLLTETFFEGKGVSIDKKRAKFYYELAIARNHFEASYKCENQFYKGTFG